MNSPDKKLTNALKKKSAEKDKEYYKRKYRRLKQMVINQVYINAALHDELIETEQKFLKAKNERKCLMKKLFQYLPMTEAQCLQSTQALNAVESSFPGKIPQTILSPVQPVTKDPVVSKKKPVQQSPSLPTTPKNTPLKQDQSKKATPDKKGDSEKPKRKKPGTVKKRVQPLHLDDQGAPLFPITLGTLTVYDLGDVVSDKPGFHSERYIWPVGYCSTRIYPSMIDPDCRIQYFCYIKDGGSEPIFEIIPEDEPNNPITAITATACHCNVLKRLNKARGKDATNTGSGPEFFGFSHPTIQYLIQCLPDADKCEKYIRQTYDFAQKSSTTSANVIRQDNLPNMEAYDRTKLELPKAVSKTMDIG